MQAEGTIREVMLLEGSSSAKIHCPPGLNPTPGQYLLAHAAGSDAPLATPIFAARVFRDGFLTSSPVPASWMPGTRLLLRGPLGNGFSLPGSARQIALVAFRSSARTLLALLEPAFRQDASVTLVSDIAPDDLPLQVEVQPPGAILEICQWADFAAFDVPRDFLPELREMFEPRRLEVKAAAQILVRTPMPCGALARCGVCTVELGAEALLACEDGPVFDFNQVMGWSSKA